MVHIFRIIAAFYEAALGRAQGLKNHFARGRKCDHRTITHSK